ncbi:MAG: EutN/CcmL family microcompartment protein [Planctomycetia bacterium]|nr:EutN/CcmL family microcompartment protein [Planctomycetia bacterium]
MRIAQVVGVVVLSRVHPSLSGGAFKLVVPLRTEDLKEIDGVDLNQRSSSATPVPAESWEEFVVYDSMGAGEGQFVGVSEGREALNPFYPDVKPIDAYNALILDKAFLS